MIACGNVVLYNKTTGGTKAPPYVEDHYISQGTDTPIRRIKKERREAQCHSVTIPVISTGAKRNGEIRIPIGYYGSFDSLRSLKMTLV